jgi:hypothetical protein
MMLMLQSSFWARQPYNLERAFIKSSYDKGVNSFAVAFWYHCNYRTVRSTPDVYRSRSGAS